jgi:iron complex outermembrane receptor protein
MIRSAVRALLAAALVSLSSGSAIAAAQPPSAVISGIVTSVDGARLPRASITATEHASGRQFRGSTDDLGAFVLDRLPAGTYTLVVEFPGLAPRTLDPLTVGGTALRIDVSLEPMRLEERVTVSAAIPRDSVEVTDVRESPARDVGELLSGSAGLWKLRKGGIASDTVLRGLQSRDLNVLVDGERIYGACPNRMDPPAFHVDFSQVERIDVGKGPFDVRYQGSLGGIVNVVTRRPEDGWRASTSLGAGSFGFLNPSATVSYGGQRLSMLGGVSYRRSDPYSDGRGQLVTSGAGYRAANVDSDAFRAATGWGKVAWRVADGHQLEASYTRQQTDHILYPYLLMDAVWDDADRLAVAYQAPRRDRRISAIKALAYWSRVDHWMTDELRLSSSTAPRAYSMGTDAGTFTAGGRVEAVVGATTVGGEAYRRNWNSETLMGGMGYRPQYSIPDVIIDAAGLFAEHARALGARAAIDVGGRIDWIGSKADASKAGLALYSAYHGTTATSRSDVLPSGRARVTYQITPGVSAAAAVGHTARVAEGNERFFALRRMGTDWVGNPGLDPARNTGVDLSLTFARPRTTFSVNGYYNAVDGYIAVYSARRRAMVPGVMNQSARSFANVDARLRGLEATGSVTVRAPLSISGDVSYVRATMTPQASLGILSRDLAETPPLRGRLRMRFDDGRVFAEVEGEASTAQTHVDRTLGETPTASYAVAHVRGGVRRGPFALTVGVSNLLDAYYVEHLSFQRDPYRSGLRVAEPGRSVFTNASWKF